MDSLVGVRPEQLEMKLQLNRVIKIAYEKIS